jgi:hypothetical protein
MRAGSSGERVVVSVDTAAASAAVAAAAIVGLGCVMIIVKLGAWLDVDIDLGLACGLGFCVHGGPRGLSLWCLTAMKGGKDTGGVDLFDSRY